jgi:hypothetical protein
MTKGAGEVRVDLIALCGNKAIRNAVDGWVALAMPVSFVIRCRDVFGQLGFP